MDINEVLEYAKTDESFANSLKENFTVEKEVVKEVQTEYTEEGVSKFISDNQSFRDKYNESVRKNTYKKLLGKDEITDEDMKTEFVTKSMLDEKYSEIKETKVELEILKKIGREAFTNEDNKSFLEVAKKAIDFGEDGELKGLEILNPLMNKTPGTKTPPKAPVPPVQKSDEEKKKELYEKAKAGDKQAAAEYRMMKYK